MKKIVLTFGQWNPDRSKTEGDHVVVADGVIPDASGYRPFLAPADNGSALPDLVRGAFIAYGPNGAIYTIAGTADSLYFRSGSTWTQAGTGYTLLEGSWDFAQYGNYVFAVNGVDNMQYSTIAGNGLSNFQPVTGAPIGSRVCVVGDFLMVGDISGDRNKLQWSVIDDPLSWPVPGSNTAIYGQSDYQIFPVGGNIQSIVSGMSGYEGLVICERAVYRMQYVGGESIFQITAVDKGIGAIARDSVVHHNNVVYFFAEDGLYATDGSSLSNIGSETINRWWSDTVGTGGRRDEVVGAVDPVNNLIVWAYPTVNAALRNYDGLLILNPTLEVKSFSTASVQTEWLYSDCSRGVTLEDLNNYGKLDDLGFSLDAKNLVRGLMTLGAFDTNHKPVLFSGLPVAAQIETTERGYEQIMIHGIRPIVDNANPTVSVKYRSSLNASSSIKQCSSASNLDRICRTRTFGRYFSVIVDIPAGTNWTHAVSTEVFYEQGGWR